LSHFVVQLRVVTSWCRSPSGIDGLVDVVVGTERFTKWRTTEGSEISGSPGAPLAAARAEGERSAPIAGTSSAHPRRGRDGRRILLVSAGVTSALPRGDPHLRLAALRGARGSARARATAVAALQAALSPRWPRFSGRSRASRTVEDGARSLRQRRPPERIHRLGRPRSRSVLKASRRGRRGHRRRKKGSRSACEWASAGARWILLGAQEDVRRLPGRLVGVTADLEGRRGYVLTLPDPRAAHPPERRPRTSARPGAHGLANTIHMTLLGRAGSARGAPVHGEAHYLGVARASGSGRDARERRCALFP